MHLYIKISILHYFAMNKYMRTYIYIYVYMYSIFLRTSMCTSQDCRGFLLRLFSVFPHVAGSCGCIKSFSEWKSADVTITVDDI